MDPRVTASAPSIRGQFDLSMACYDGLDEIQHLLRENQSVRTQIAALLGAVQDPALKDSLVSLDRKLAASAGGGPPDDLDIIYTTVRDDRTVRAYKQVPEEVYRRLCSAPNPVTYWEDRIAEEYPKAQPKGGAAQDDAAQRFSDLFGGGAPD